MLGTLIDTRCTARLI